MVGSRRAFVLFLVFGEEGRPSHDFSYFFARGAAWAARAAPLFQLFFFLEVLSGKEKETKRHYDSLTIQRVSLNQGSMIAFIVLCRSAVVRP